MKPNIGLALLCRNICRTQRRLGKVMGVLFLSKMELKKSHMMLKRGSLLSRVAMRKKTLCTLWKKYLRTHLVTGTSKIYRERLKPLSTKYNFPVELKLDPYNRSGFSWPKMSSIQDIVIQDLKKLVFTPHLCKLYLIVYKNKLLKFLQLKSVGKEVP